MTAFLTGLFKAVEVAPNAALVYTLAIGKDKLAIDAYSEENQFIVECMEEAESVSARKATLLDPTEEDETARILRRRLFTHIDDDRANAPLRFSTEANLTQMVRRQEKQVDGGVVRAELNDRIKSIFGGKDFQMVPFPNIPNDIPDDAGDGKPHLAVIGYDAVEVSGEGTTLPDTGNIPGGC